MPADTAPPARPVPIHRCLFGTIGYWRRRKQAGCALRSAHPPCWLPCAGGGGRCADRQAWGEHYPDLSRRGTGRQCHGSLGAQESGDRLEPPQTGWLGKEAASEIRVAQRPWKLLMPPGWPPGWSCVPVGGCSPRASALLLLEEPHQQCPL